ncbi:hypothetical protein GCM10009857_34440 [Agromyces soli]
MTGELTTAPRKRGRPTESERAQRRDDILDAAVRLFVASGFAQVSLDDLAAEARVTKRTIYAYFGDRTEIFLAAVARLRERALRRPTTEQGLAALAADIVAVLHSDEAVGLHRLMITESGAFPDLAAGFYRDGPDSYIGELRDRLRSGGLPEELAEPLFALLLGEPHRQRLLALRPAPDREAAAAHAQRALAALGLGA